MNSPLDVPYSMYIQIWPNPPLAPAGDEYWWCANAEVIIQDETNPYNGRMGYIKQVLGGTCIVGVYDQYRVTSESNATNVVEVL